MMGSSKGNWGRYGLQAFGISVLGPLLFYLINPIIEHFKGNRDAGAITYIAGMVGTKEVKSTVSLIKTGAKTAGGYAQYGYAVLKKNLDAQLEGAIRAAIHSKQINPSQLKGFAAGLGGAAVNVGIGIAAENNIKDYQKEASDENKNANKDDKLNSINVVSIQG